MSRIEQCIAEIEEYIDNCKFQPLSNSKIVVNRDDIEELLDELKENIPEEIQKYKKIISNRDAILADAQEKAEEMIRKANEMTATLVSEHEIMQQAYKEANTVIEDATIKAGGIIDKATMEANEVRAAATRYLDEELANIQQILQSSIQGIAAANETAVGTLSQNLQVATANRNSLYPDSQIQQEAEPVEQTGESGDISLM